jgi:hypothetical protein
MRRQKFGASPKGNPSVMSQWRRRHDRRIGARVPLNGAQLSWTPVLKPIKRFRNRGLAGTATVFDLSLSGARVRAPYDPRIIIGTQIQITAGGAGGIAEVRRINAADSPDEALYGIHFVRLDAALLRLFNDTLAARQPEQQAGGT